MRNAKQGNDLKASFFTINLQLILTNLFRGLQTVTEPLVTSSCLPTVEILIYSEYKVMGQLYVVRVFKNEDISEFLKENENKNTARKTSQDVAFDM